MAIESKGAFTDIDNMLMKPLTETTDNTITHLYCTLAAQLKYLCALYNIFMAKLCCCPRFVVIGYKKPKMEQNLKIVLKPQKLQEGEFNHEKSHYHNIAALHWNYHCWL